MMSRWLGWLVFCICNLLTDVYKRQVKSYTEDTDSSNDNRVNNFNPIDKITELYERLLKEKDEKYAALERRLQNIEKSLQK